jgi:hypothetical protein
MVINSTNINKANDNLSPQAIKHKKNTPHGVGNPDPVLGQPVDVGVQVLSWDNLLMLESRSCLGTTSWCWSPDPVLGQPVDVGVQVLSWDSLLMLEFQVLSWDTLLRLESRSCLGTTCWCWSPVPVLGQPVDVGVQILSWDNLLMLESRSCLGTAYWCWSPGPVLGQPVDVGNPDPVLGQPVDVGVQVLSWDNLLMLESRPCLGTTCGCWSSYNSYECYFCKWCC